MDTWVWIVLAAAAVLVLVAVVAGRRMRDRRLHADERPPDRGELAHAEADRLRAQRAQLQEHTRISHHGDVFWP